MLTLKFDADRDLFVIDGNRADVFHVARDAATLLAEIRAKPGVPIFVYRDKPETGMLDRAHISNAGIQSEDLGDALKGRRIAALLEAGARFAVGRQVASFVEGLGIDYRPFTDETEALRWLGR